jgi:alpha-1,2-mannosyltransferase
MDTFMVQQEDTGLWLTSRRLRAHGLILGTALWSVYVWTIGTPGLLDRYGNLKGTDFLHFYTLGLLAREHQGTQLYDMRAQAVLAAAHVPQAAGISYLPLYPPQVSLLFAPLAHLSYVTALAFWCLISAGIYFFCCHWTWRACDNLQSHRTTVVILCAAFPAFFHLIAWGQTSALALLCFTAMYFCLRSRRDLLAGVVLGCLAFKPQLGLAAAVVFLASGAWKVLIGAALSAAAQFLAGIPFYGNQAFHEWLWMIRNVRQVLPFLEPKTYQTHCLRTFWSMLIPWSPIALILYAATAVLVLVLTISLWRRRSISLSIRYSELLFATVLIAPHLTVYDLVILTPAMLFLSDGLLAMPPKALAGKIGTALYGVYVLPLVGPLAIWTHVQLSVMAMAAVLWLLWQQSRSPDAMGVSSQKSSTT